MPSDIYFASENLRVTVDEDPARVAEAFTSARGLPFRLTGHGGRGEVYINPAMVAFWSESGPNRDSELQEESPPQASKRETVTNIWGKPIQRKPRR